MTNTDKTVSTVLLPCPFCGSKPYAHVQNSTSNVAGDPNRYLQMVWCDDCGTQGPHRDTEDQAIAAWNSRASRTQSPAEWQVERTMTGETVNGIPVLGWLTYNDVPGAGVIPRVDFHWSTPDKGKEVIRLVDASALRSASITPPAPERSKEEVGVKVKPLEWDRDTYAGWTEAKTTIGTYCAYADGTLVLEGKQISYERGRSWGDTEAAAQADYEQRIRSALEPASLHKVEGHWSDDKTYEEAPAPLPVGVTPTHRHKKRGTEYVLIGIGKMQTEEWLSRVQPVDGTAFGFAGNALMPVDMREVAVYRSATDPAEIWVRPREEFEDGRFEALSPKPGEG